MVHLAPPPAPLAATQLASSPQVIPSLSPDDENPLETLKSSSGSSSRPNDDYTLAKPDIANGFLSSTLD